MFESGGRGPALRAKRRRLRARLRDPAASAPNGREIAWAAQAVSPIRGSSRFAPGHAKLFAAKHIRLQWTEVDGEPVAFDCGCVDRDGVYVYQTGFDPAKSDLSPGRLHFQASIKRSIEEGYRFFDFLRGDEPYKAHLRAKPIGVLETRLIAPRAALLGHRLWSSNSTLQMSVACPARNEGLPAAGRDAARTSAAPADAAQPDAGPAPIALAQRPQPIEVEKKRWRAVSVRAARFGVGSVVMDVAYRAARRCGRLQVVELVNLKLADLSPARRWLAGMSFRWLTADEVCPQICGRSGQRPRRSHGLATCQWPQLLSCHCRWFTAGKLPLVCARVDGAGAQSGNRLFLASRNRVPVQGVHASRFSRQANPSHGHCHTRFRSYAGKAFATGRCNEYANWASLQGPCGLVTAT